MENVVDSLREHLIANGIVRRPDVAGPGPRPWLPPAWKHPDLGALGAGDAADSDRPANTHDDGIVVSIFVAPGMAPALGEEERRRHTVDVVIRGNAVPPIFDLETEIRHAVLDDPAEPGGRCDWVMAGLYIIQALEYRPFQPISTEAGGFTFSVGYLFEVRAT